MLIDQFFSALASFLGWVFSALPVSSLAALLQDVTSAAHSIGLKLSPWNAYLPLSELLTIATLLVTVWLPCLLIYIGANWTWRHIPDLFGFGPGAG